MESSDLYLARFAFIETLSREFIAMTGCGIYAYLNPVDVDQLFNSYRNLADMPIRTFARRCIRNVLG